MYYYILSFIYIYNNNNNKKKYKKNIKNNKLQTPWKARTPAQIYVKSIICLIRKFKEEFKR